MTLQESDDFERFLSNVDQISELVKEFNSSNVLCQEKAFEKADQFIASLEQEEPCQTKINKTIINADPSSENRPLQVQCIPSQNPESFIRILEKDAEERRQRREMKVEKANSLREKGNEAFTQGDYETAVRFYTEGLDQLRDMQTLYTNRAQAFIKLKRYKEAISDCEWALRCNEKCIKAYIHMGKSYLALRNFPESRMCYRKILEIEPQQDNMVKAYLTQVDLEEKVVLQEMAAWNELQEGTEQATAITELLKKLDRPNEINLYYCGGVELLTQAIKNFHDEQTNPHDQPQKTDAAPTKPQAQRLLDSISECTGQTLFRINNGFSIINGNNIVRSCLSPSFKDPCAVDLCVSVLRLWRAVCGGNEQNQQLLIECPNAREYIVQMLASPLFEIHRECLELLSIYSHTQYGRDLLLDNLNLCQMAENLMGCICRDMSSASVLTFLENLTAENKFKIQSRENFTAVFALPFEHLLSNIVTANHKILGSLISVIGSMALDDVIGKKMASREEFWRCSLLAMEQRSGCEFRSVLYPLLGLMINLGSNSSQAIQKHAVLTSSRCLGLLSDPHGGIITRAAGLLSVLLPESLSATQEVVEKGIVKKLLKILKGGGEMSSRYSIKALTVCTASIPPACEELVKLDKGLRTLRKLLSSIDEVVVGNAALCMGHCIGVDGAATSLLDTDCVLLLLRHAASNTKRAAVQQNAAITLGKLCKKEPRHMGKLRELHGLEILHSCVRLIT